MKQEWYCESCNTLGAVRMRKNIDAWGGTQAVKDDHARQSPNCPDASKVRIRAPQCSTREWNRVSRRQENRRKDLASDKLFKSVGSWLKVNGGGALIAGPVGIMDKPNLRDLGIDPHRFYVCIQITGRRPTK